MTTVRLKPRTKEKIDFLKRELKKRSYDELIDVMADNMKTRISMFGTDPDLGGWSEVLRDEIRKDRY